MQLSYSQLPKSYQKWFHNLAGYFAAPLKFFTVYQIEFDSLCFILIHGFSCGPFFLLFGFISSYLIYFVPQFQLLQLCAYWFLYVFSFNLLCGKKVRGNSGSRSSKTLTKTTTVKRKTEKKVYTLPGQKHDPPEEVFDLLLSFNLSLNLFWARLKSLSNNYPLY